jgi:predicted esterase
MPYTTYDQLNQQLLEHFQNKQYAEALELVLTEGNRFPDDRIWIDYWKMVSAARVGNRAFVYEVARKSLTDGFWYGEVMWRQSPSFEPLQGDPEFEQIVAASYEAELKDQPSSEPVSITKLPANHSAKSPLLIALHGNQANPARTLPFWESAVQAGWVLFVPQSNQAMFKDGFAWGDLEKSKAFVASQYKALTKGTVFNPEQIVVAGHSMGGLLAIQMALQGLLLLRGFIANGPGVPYLDESQELEALLPAARARGLRGYFILGEKDDVINVDEIKYLMEKLRAAGIACEFEMIPNATHEYDPAYDIALQRGLRFVIDNR